jgi:hypothetical protein
MKAAKLRCDTRRTRGWRHVKADCTCSYTIIRDCHELPRANPRKLLLSYCILHFSPQPWFIVPDSGVTSMWILRGWRRLGAPVPSFCGVPRLGSPHPLVLSRTRHLRRLHETPNRHHMKLRNRLPLYLLSLAGVEVAIRWQLRGAVI